MRKIIVVLGFIALVWIGYVAWPIPTLLALTRAIDAGDYATVMHYVDQTALRRSIADQVFDSYLKLSGKAMSPLLRGAIASASESIADPIVSKIVAPDLLVHFLRHGWPDSALQERPATTTGLSEDSVGNAWQIFMAAEYGIGQFEIDVPETFSRERRLGLQFRLIQWRWKLSGVRLPEHLRIRLAEALGKLLSKR